MSTGVNVEVYGIPVPQGSIRSLGKGRPSIHSNAATLLPWREQVQHAIEANRDASWPWSGPVTVHAWFTVRKPKSAPKTRVTYPVTRPDIDKLSRAVLDAITASGLIGDDSQVTCLLARKAYPVTAADVRHVGGRVLTAPGLWLNVFRASPEPLGVPHA